MSQTRLSTIDVKRTNTFNELLRKLKTLDGQLPGSELARLTAFNSAYLVVTTAISEAVNNGYFENPLFIEKFTISFSHYYFRAINDYLKSKNMPMAWSRLLSKNRNERLPNFIYLLMGANAHINHDLSLVMVKMLDNGDTENLHKDIIKVDKLLLGSGKDILDTFNEPKRTPRIIKNKLKYAYLPLIMHIILYWRVKAWKDYLNIKNNGLDPNRSQTKGKAISNRLIKLGKLLDC